MTVEVAQKEETESAIIYKNSGKFFAEHSKINQLGKRVFRDTSFCKIILIVIIVTMILYFII